MKNISNIFKLVLVLAVFLSGCSMPNRQAKMKRDKRTAAEKRFDPLGFVGDDSVITGRSAAADSLPARKPSPETAMVTETPLLPPAPDTLVPADTLPHEVIFRVQVYASKSFDEAQKFAAEIESMFPESVYVEYQMPYYKVRLGEFSDPDEGEQFLQEVKDMGFKKAWLVRVIK